MTLDPSSPTPSRPSVLLVDGHADSIDMYALAFRHSGFDVATAATSDDAIVQLTHRMPSAVALELRLNGALSGYELCRRVRARADAHAVPLVAVTSLAYPSDVARATAAGCTVVLTKPCLPDTLVSEVRRLLARAAPTSRVWADVDGRATAYRAAGG